MEDLQLLKNSEGKSPDEMMLDMTVLYLNSLPPATKTAIYYGAILRWFNPEVLAGVMGEEGPSTPDEVYTELQQLPFSEVFPKRGHSFHDLTRKTILQHLWQHHRQFYEETSKTAATWFANRHVTLLAESRRRPDKEYIPMDATYLIEYAYHYAIATPANAGANIHLLLDDLLHYPLLGAVHAVNEAVGEHAAAGRLLPITLHFLHLWQLKEAIATRDLDRMHSLHSLFTSFPDINPTLRAIVHFTYAEGLRVASLFEESQKYFEIYWQYAREEGTPEEQMSAEQGLATIAMARENFNKAKGHFENSLLLLTQIHATDTSREILQREDVRQRLLDPMAWHQPIEKDTQPEEQIKGKKQQIPWSLASPQEGATRIPIMVNSDIARVWQELGSIYAALDQYLLAGICGQVAMNIYSDLDDLAGEQTAVSFLQDLGETVGNEKIIAASRKYRRILIDEAAQKSDHRTVIDGLISEAQALTDEDDYEGATAEYDRALRIARQLGLQTREATIITGLAGIDSHQGRYEEAEKKFRETADLFKKINAPEGYAITLGNLGAIYCNRLRLEEAEKEYQAALQVFRELGAFSGIFTCLIGLAQTNLKKGRNSEALGFVEQAREMAVEAGRKSYEIRANTEMAEQWLAMGEDQIAEGLFGQTLANAAMIGQADLSKAIFVGVARVLSSRAEYQRANVFCDQLLATGLQSKECYNIKGWSMENVGVAHAEECVSAFEKAHELEPKDHWTEKELAGAYLRAGATEKANAILLSMVNRLEKYCPPAHLSILAECYFLSGRLEKAEEVFNQVIDAGMADSWTYFDLGLVLLNLHKFEASLDVYKQGLLLQNRTLPTLLRRDSLFVAKRQLALAEHADPLIAGSDVLALIQQALQEAWDKTGPAKAD